MASIYDGLLPTQTYISQNKPQYISVFDNVLRPGQPGTVGSPLSIQSPDTTKTATVAVANTGVTTLTSPDNIILNSAENISAVCGATGSVLLGNQTIVGGTTVSVAGPAGPGQVYDVIYNPPQTAPVGVLVFSSNPTITHNTVSTYSYTIPTGVGTKQYILTMSGMNGFSDDATPPSIPNNGVLQIWIENTTGGGYLAGGSPASISHAEFEVRPSAGISTYLTGTYYNKASKYFQLAPGTYNIRYAWWSNQNLVLGAFPNNFTFTLWRFN